MSVLKYQVGFMSIFSHIAGVGGGKACPEVDVQIFKGNICFCGGDTKLAGITPQPQPKE